MKKQLSKFLTLIILLTTILFAAFSQSQKLTSPVLAQNCRVSPTTIPEGRVSEVTLTASGLSPRTVYEVRYRDRNREQHGRIGRTDSNGNLSTEFDISRNVDAGSLTIRIQPVSGGDIACGVTLTVAGATPSPTPTGSPGPTGTPSPTGSPSPQPPGEEVCPEGVCQTALGPIPTEPGALVTAILRIAIGAAGGIAFILMVIGAVRMLVSAGDPEALAAGRDMLTSAIAGLLFIIFSVVILRIIGLNILNIPDFSGMPGVPGGPGP